MGGGGSCDCDCFHGGGVLWSRMGKEGLSRDGESSKGGLTGGVW